MGLIGVKKGFLQGSLKRGPNSLERGPNGADYVKNEIFARVFEGGGGETAKWGCLKGIEGTDKSWKGISAEMDHIGPCNNPCQLSPWSAGPLPGQDVIFWG